MERNYVRAHFFFLVAHRLLTTASSTVIQRDRYISMIHYTEKAKVSYCTQKKFTLPIINHQDVTSKLTLISIILCNYNCLNITNLMFHLVHKLLFEKLNHLMNSYDAFVHFYLNLMLFVSTLFLSFCFFFAN